jgi:hypothetical protein
VEVREGKFFCILCGAELEVSEAQTVTTIAGASGKPNVRILSVNGEELHRCEMPSRGPRRP